MAYTLPRTNHEMAAIVDFGIAIADQFGVAEGGRFMCAQKVPLEVALRVLARPDQRRQYR